MNSLFSVRLEPAVEKSANGSSGLSPSMSSQSASPLDDLYTQIIARKGADPKTSYTAKLLAAGVSKAAKKLGEEAVEAVIAAVAGDREQLILESTDVLYHLLVVWAACGVTPDDVMKELMARRGRSGLDEKASRKS